MPTIRFFPIGQSNCNQAENGAELYKDCVHTLNMNKIVEQTKHRTHT